MRAFVIVVLHPGIKIFLKKFQVIVQFFPKSNGVKILPAWYDANVHRCHLFEDGEPGFWCDQFLQVTDRAHIRDAPVYL